MKHYDPLLNPDPEEWLELDDDDKTVLISEYHEKEQIDLPNVTVHAVIHLTIENQLAEGTPDVRDALSRLMEEGLGRHDAVHAIGSVFAETAWSVLQPDAEDIDINEEYLERVRTVSADDWGVDAATAAALEIRQNKKRKVKKAGPPKIYVELRMTGREKSLVVDNPLSLLGFEDRFEESPDGKHFVARLNRNEMEDLLDSIAALSNHEEDAGVQDEMDLIYDRCSDILDSMG